MVSALSRAPSPPSRRCVVVTYNSARTIEACLRSLAGESVIVVDNGSSDDTLAKVRRFDGDVRVIALQGNHGFAHGANLGFKHATPNDVALVNPDAMPAPGTLDRLAMIAETRGAGLVGPRLVYPDGLVQESARTFPCFSRLAARRTRMLGTRLRERLEASYVAPAFKRHVCPVDWVIGAVMYIPRRSLDEVGGFDERFFLYAEDVDLCTRLWRAGRPVLLDPHSVATHAYARQSKRTFDLRQAATRHHWTSIARLAGKYPTAFWLGADARDAGHGRGAVSGNGHQAGPRAEGASEVDRARPAPRPHVRGEIGLPFLAVERARQMIDLYQNWPLAIADRLGLVRTEGVVYTVRRDFGRARLVARANGCDVRTITEIWAGELYTRRLRHEAGEADGGAGDGRPVVVDIGANCGYFAVYAGLRLPGARVVCFEPEESNRVLAATNVALNGVNAEIHGRAVVADGRDVVELNLSDDPRLHTTIPRADAGRHGIDTGRYRGTTVSVPAVNINAALRPLLQGGRVALLKIDVEGLDLELVAALDDDVLAGIDCLVAETEDRDTVAITARLAEAGFSVEEDVNLLLALRTERVGP